MKDTYFSSHDENRMKNEGNVEAAREYFFRGKTGCYIILLNKDFHG